MKGSLSSEGFVRYQTLIIVLSTQGIHKCNQMCFINNKKWV